MYGSVFPTDSNDCGQRETLPVGQTTGSGKDPLWFSRVINTLFCISCGLKHHGHVMNPPPSLRMRVEILSHRSSSIAIIITITVFEKYHLTVSEKLCRCVPVSTSSPQGAKVLNKAFKDLWPFVLNVVSLFYPTDLLQLITVWFTLKGASRKGAFALWPKKIRRDVLWPPKCVLVILSVFLWRTEKIRGMFYILPRRNKRQCPDLKQSKWRRWR